MILSRAAMRRQAKDDQESGTCENFGSVLTRKHSKALLHDCCGVSFLDEVLHEQGIGLAGLWPMCNPHPPHGVPFAETYCCQPMIGMHKPSERDVKVIFRWEYGFREYNVSESPPTPQARSDLICSDPSWCVT